MGADYPYAQWFEPARPCRVCGKPAGALHSFYQNSILAYMCEKHAEKAIKDAHRKKSFYPDAVVEIKEGSTTPSEAAS